MKTSIKSIFGAFVLSSLLVVPSFAQDGAITRPQDQQDQTEMEQEDNWKVEQQGKEQGEEKPGELGNQQLGQEEGKTQISPQTLPAEVTESIATGDFSDWRIAKVYKLEESHNREAEYEIHFEDPQGNVETEMYNKEGKVVDA